MESSSNKKSTRASSATKHNNADSLRISVPPESKGRSQSAVNPSPRVANVELKEAAPLPVREDRHQVGNEGGARHAMSANVATSNKGTSEGKGASTVGSGRMFSAPPVAPWSSSKRLGSAPIGAGVDASSRIGRDIMSATPKLIDGDRDSSLDNRVEERVKLPSFESKREAGAMDTMNLEWGASTAGNYNATALSSRLYPSHNQMPLLLSPRASSPPLPYEITSGPGHGGEAGGVIDKNGITYHTADGEFLLTLNASENVVGTTSNNTNHAYSRRGGATTDASGRKVSMAVNATDPSDAQSTAASDGDFDNLKSSDPLDREQHAAVTGALAEGMNLAELQDYLSVHGFLHVTPRFNIEPVKRMDWYDLVILEVPGNCKTGMVYRKKIGNSSETFPLERHQVVQLSLDGALVYGEPTLNPDDRDSELLPLKDLIKEKAMAEAVRKLKFFKYYREARTFLFLKNAMKKARLQRMRNRLTTHSIFSHVPLIIAMQKIRGLTLDLEESTELFCFNGHGSQHVSAYLELQMARVRECKEEITKAIHGISAFIEQEHDNLTSETFLKDDINNVQKHHPYLLAEELGMPVAWSEVRSIKVVRSRMHTKIESLCYVAQFMVEYAMARILERFWKRATLFTRGLYHVPVGRYGRTLSETYRNQYKALIKNDERKSENKIRQTGYWTISEGNTSDPWTSSGALTGKDPGESGGDSDNQGGSHSNNEGHGHEEEKTKDKNRSEITIENTIPYHSAKPSVLSGNNAILDVSTETATTSAVRALLAGVEHHDSVEIDEEWEREGSHAHLDIALCLDSYIASSSMFINTSNFNRLRVRVMPGKYSILDQMHSLCGQIGHMLENLPNLRKLPLITTADRIVKEDPTVLATVDVEDGATATSINYFSYLHIHHIVACTHGLRMAIDWLRIGQAAHGEGVKVEAQMSRLQETFRRLHMIHPDSLAQQLQRSLVLSKIKEIIDSPETADDVGRAINRDKSRLNALGSAVTSLESAREVAGMYANLKHRHGFISNFRLAAEQILDICAIKETRLFSKLPSVFYMRTTQFTSNLNALVDEFELEGAELSKQIALLQKLKNFEKARDAFDLEIEVCEGLYHQIKKYNESHRRYDNTERVKNIDDINTDSSAGAATAYGGGGGRRNRKASLNTTMNNQIRDNDIGACFNAYESARHRLLAAIGTSRSLLIGMLAHMRGGALERRRIIHNSVTAETVALRNIETVYQEARRVREKKEKDDWVEEQKSYGRSVEVSPLDPMRLLAIYYSTNDGEILSEVDTQEREMDLADLKKNTITFPNVSRHITNNDINNRISLLEQSGERIGELKKDFEEIMKTQDALLDAHDIIGAAAPILLPSETDYFTDLVELEEIFTTKKAAWDSIKGALTMKRHITASRLSNLSAHQLQKRLDKLIKALTNLESSNLDEVDTLPALRMHVEDLVPKLEVISYLSSGCLRPRHWRWLSDMVLTDCGLKLKFAGEAGEQITVYDVRGREPFGMGFVSRLSVADILFRGVDSHLDKIRRLTSDAAIEGMIEQTMDQ